MPIKGNLVLIGCWVNHFEFMFKIIVRDGDNTDKMINISIIVPLFYGRKYLSHLLEILDRNRKTLKWKGISAYVELILINDSPEKIMLEDIEGVVLYENEKNIGVHASRIKGLAHSRGDFVLFLDQDDYIDDYYLYSQISKIGECGAIICNGYYRQKKLIFKVGKIPTITKKNFYLFYNAIVSPGQVLIRRKCIPKEWQDYIITYSGADDIFLWLLLANNNIPFAKNEDIIYTHVEHGNNESYNWAGQVRSLEELLDFCKKIGNINSNVFDSINKSIIKLSLYSELETKWKIVYEKGLSIADFFQHNNVKRVAIYGYGVIGKKLLDELIKEQISVEYMVDKAEKYQDDDIKVYRPEDNFPQVDIMVVTAVFAFAEIKQQFCERNINIVSLEEIIDTLLKL